MSIYVASTFGGNLVLHEVSDLLYKFIKVKLISFKISSQKKYHWSSFEILTNIFDKIEISKFLVIFLVKLLFELFPKLEILIKYLSNCFLVVIIDEQVSTNVILCYLSILELCLQSRVSLVILRRQFQCSLVNFTISWI